MQSPLDRQFALRESFQKKREEAARKMREAKAKKNAAEAEENTRGMTHDERARFEERERKRLGIEDYGVGPDSIDWTQEDKDCDCDEDKEEEERRRLGIEDYGVDPPMNGFPEDLEAELDQGSMGTGDRAPKKNAKSKKTKTTDGNGARFSRTSKATMLVEKMRKCKT